MNGLARFRKSVQFGFTEVVVLSCPHCRTNKISMTSQLPPDEVPQKSSALISLVGSAGFY